MRLLSILCLSFALLAVTVAEETMVDITTEADTPAPKPTDPPAPKTTSVSPITTSSSTAAPTTLAPPPPNPPQLPLPKAGDYNLSTGNLTCVMAHFSAQFDIPYVNTANASTVANLNIENATVSKNSSPCDLKATNLNLILDFGDSDSVKLSFVSKDKSQWVDEVELTYKIDNITFPGHPDEGKEVTLTFVNQTLFKVQNDKSYKCNTDEGKGPENAVVKFSEARVDAFRTGSGDTVREAVECANDDQVNDLVPIAVGCALLALVVIVLIAYFIGRRRSRRLAYQSV